MRSVWVPWSLALREADRLLDDLSRYTTVDGVELLDFRSQIDRANYGAAGGPAQRVLPSSAGLGLDLPVVGRDVFRAAERFMREATSRGFKVTCNFVPMWSGSDKLLGSALVDVRGRRVSGPADFPVHGCPNNPDMLKFGQYMIREIVRRWPDMEILALNHLEYPYLIDWSVPRMDVDALFSCFCEECERVAEEQGIDFQLMKKEVRSFVLSLGRGKGGVLQPANADDVAHFFLRRPRLAEWLNFRMESLTRYSHSLIAEGRRASKEHNPKLRFGMEYQLPSLSPMIGTDFLALSSDLDLMIPKFPDYLAASVVPLLAREVAARRGLDEGELLRFIRNAFDLGPGPARYREYPRPSHILIYSNAYDYTIFERQMKYLKPLMGKVAFQPYIWENNRNWRGLDRKIDALAKLGFDDFYLWNWEEGLSTEHLRRLKGIL